MWCTFPTPRPIQRIGKAIRCASKRWMWVLWLAGTAGALQVIYRVLRPGPLRLAPSEQNPFGLEAAAPLLPAIDLAAQVGLVLALLLWRPDGLMPARSAT